MSEMSAFITGAKVMPILTIAEAAHAAPLARALSAGGVKTCEVTLRTPAALAAITAMRAAAPDLRVGAGTIRSAQDVDDALGAGAQFLVTPGTPAALAQALLTCGAPVLPGCATASEAMTLADLGFRVLKFFPAEQAGGAAYLKALAGPLPELMFCPTGGISAARAPDYLALANVACVGGSWLAPEGLLAAGDYSAITALARAAMAL